LTGNRLSIEIVEGLLRESCTKKGGNPSRLDVIQKRVAEHLTFVWRTMSSKAGGEHCVPPANRDVLARQLTDSSLNIDRRSLRRSRHGTVLHACRLVKDA